MNEQDLIQGIRAGSPGAIRYFVARYQQMIFALCCQMLQQEVWAEEATQDVLLQCIRKMDRYEGRSRLSTWVYQIARNHALNELRKRKSAPETLEFNSETHGSFESPSDKKELKKWVRQFIGSLPEKQRELVTLFYLNELNLKEISALTGETEGSIKVNLFRARQALKSRITDRDAELLNDLRHG
ncbi:sigma-70 family RNA polymerase sigma factor [bacterium SCSIO 12741]|nr:sigma-70 family RNA polymerase sigma factor [bacterium SCSIO 12741]